MATAQKSAAKKAAAPAAKKVAPVAAKKAAPVAFKKAAAPTVAQAVQRAMQTAPAAKKAAAPAAPAVQAPRAVFDRESADDSVILGILRSMPDACAAKKVQALVNAVRAKGYRTSMGRVERLIPDAMAGGRGKTGNGNGKR